MPGGGRYRGVSGRRQKGYGRIHLHSHKAFVAGGGTRRGRATPSPLQSALAHYICEASFGCGRACPSYLRNELAILLAGRSHLRRQCVQVVPLPLPHWRREVQNRQRLKRRLKQPPALLLLLLLAFSLPLLPLLPFPACAALPPPAQLRPQDVPVSPRRLSRLLNLVGARLLSVVLAVAAVDVCSEETSLGTTGGGSGGDER